MRKGNLRLGYASWGFRETPLEKQLEIVSRDGLDVLELGIHGSDNDFLGLNPTDEQIEYVKGLFKKYGVELLCASTGNDFTSDTESVKNSVEEVKNVLLTASKLGVKYLRIFAGFAPKNEVVGEKFDLMIAALNEVASFADSVGVAPVVETHGGVNASCDGVEHYASVSTDLETLKKILDSVKTVGVNFDPANLSAVGIDNIVEYYKTIEPRVKYAHLKDFKVLNSGKLEPTYLGNGKTDFSELLPIMELKDMPALFEYEPVEDVEFGLKKCLDFVMNF